MNNFRYGHLFIRRCYIFLLFLSKAKLLICNPMTNNETRITYNCGNASKHEKKSCQYFPKYICYSFCDNMKSDLPKTDNPADIEESSCPSGSILYNGQCRKVICPEGEYYKGKCLKSKCPDKLVWRDHRCQEPVFISTVLEITNIQRHEGYYTDKHKSPLNRTIFIQNRPIQHTTSPQSAATKTLSLQYNDGCCKLITPRICKLFGTKWICFHRSYKRCLPNVCKQSIVYLKPSNVSYQPPTLVMPPTPSLVSCVKPNDRKVNDCSGCAEYIGEKCSPYCYRYLCIDNTCNFIDMEEYCRKYLEPGCNLQDGCIFDWCSSGI